MMVLLALKDKGVRAYLQDLCFHFIRDTQERVAGVSSLAKKEFVLLLIK